MKMQLSSPDMICLFDWFNVRQHVMAIQTGCCMLGQGNWLKQLRTANEKQCIHSSYNITQNDITKNARWHRNIRYQLICLTYLLRQRLYHHESDPTLSAACMTVHTYARSIILRHKYYERCHIFLPYTGSQGNSMCIDKRQSIQLCPLPHGVTRIRPGPLSRLFFRQPT